MNNKMKCNRSKKKHKKKQTYHRTNCVFINIIELKPNDVIIMTSLSKKKTADKNPAGRYVYRHIDDRPNFLVSVFPLGS